MTVKELYENCKLKSSLKVLDAGTGKIYCYEYCPNKKAHEKISKMQVVSLWAEMKTTKSSFGNYAMPYICVFAFEP